jgi:hypothetical protein
MEQQSKPSTQWKPAEDRILIDAITTGSYTTLEISELLGRTQKAIWSRTKTLKIMGLLEDRKYVARKMGTVTAWTADEDKTLWEAYFTDYLTMEQIGQMMGRSLGSVRCRLAVLRKANPAQ